MAKTIAGFLKHCCSLERNHGMLGPQLAKNNETM